jgi:dihydrofolate reductase
MGRLTFGAIMSLDGFVVDASGDFSWAAPSEEVHAFVNEVERPTGTYLYGRRMYEVMSVWQDWPGPDEDSQAVLEYAQIWRGADKIVYSTTLRDVVTTSTQLRPTFDADEIRALKASSDRDISIGGPTLAAHAMAAGLVDDFHFFVVPEIVGTGTRALPSDVRLSLTLVTSHAFANGTLYSHYRPAA